MIRFTTAISDHYQNQSSDTMDKSTSLLTERKSSSPKDKDSAQSFISPSENQDYVFLNFDSLFSISFSAVNPPPEKDPSKSLIFIFESVAIQEKGQQKNYESNLIGQKINIRQEKSSQQQSSVTPLTTRDKTISKEDKQQSQPHRKSTNNPLILDNNEADLSNKRIEAKNPSPKNNPQCVTHDEAPDIFYKEELGFHQPKQISCKDETKTSFARQSKRPSTVDQSQQIKSTEDSSLPPVQQQFIAESKSRIVQPNQRSKSNSRGHPSLSLATGSGVSHQKEEILSTEPKSDDFLPLQLILKQRSKVKSFALDQLAKIPMNKSNNKRNISLNVNSTRSGQINESRKSQKAEPSNSEKENYYCTEIWHEQTAKNNPSTQKPQVSFEKGNNNNDILLACEKNFGRLSLNSNELQGQQGLRLRQQSHNLQFGAIPLPTFCEGQTYSGSISTTNSVHQVKLSNIIGSSSTKSNATSKYNLGTSQRDNSIFFKIPKSRKLFKIPVKMQQQNEMTFFSKSPINGIMSRENIAQHSQNNQQEEGITHRLGNTKNKHAHQSKDYQNQIRKSNIIDSEAATSRFKNGKSSFDLPLSRNIESDHIIVNI